MKLRAMKHAAHHGMTAKTHHGLGGMKPYKMKMPKEPHPKSGIKVPRKAHSVKIVGSMHAPRPGKGMHNHLKKVI